ncbi:MAG TPA: DUF3160 domain-containing protein [Chitinophagales bacterium]|nr:DUF3160 domain-containing protein [Chitinophagales bacterium]
MKWFSLFIAFATCSLIFSSCKQENKKQETEANPPAASENSQSVFQPTIDTSRVQQLSQLNADTLLNMDMNQDLSKLSLQDLRLLKNTFSAEQGYLFMEADLRGYFSAHLPDYDKKMKERFWAEDAKEKYPAITFTKEQQQFIARIDSFMKIRLQQNYITVNGRKLANASNIINLFQLKSYSPEFYDKLFKNNFVIVPNNNIQLFHVYEQNDYYQIPNFITTDMYLQLFHMYFSYVLKSLEEKKFIPILTDLTNGLYMKCMQAAGASSNSEVKSLAEFNAAFFAIPNELLTGTGKPIPPSWKEMYAAEIKNIKSERDTLSDFLNFKQAYFPYSLYKPRGHYTRKEELKKYFKAMMWLQTAVMCRDSVQQFNRACFMAYLLNSDAGLMQQYRSVYEPIVFLIGVPDNLSVLDICDILKKNNWTTTDQVFQPKTLRKINSEMIELTKEKNRIKPKVGMSCVDKINFMPQRYLPDNEVLNTTFDPTANAPLAYPKGTHVFAAMGSPIANEVVMNEDDDGAKWKEFVPEIKKLKEKFTDYKEWEASVYNKWLEMLIALQQPDKNYPPLMQTKEWAMKNLNTALASWSQLKHDAILYGEQPEAAECGDGGPPDPITVGYVEPNLAFWNKMIELIDLTSKVLNGNNLMTDDIKNKTDHLKEHITMLKNISGKELSGTKLNEQEYKEIEIAGSTVEYLTLSVLDPDKNLDSWSLVQGPDKSIAVVADVFTRNIMNCEKNGILHEATGYVYDLYAVVEIEGYLYLTKGATYTYHEFVQPLGKRLTDEDWQKMLETNHAPPLPDWIKELIVPGEYMPKFDERIYYSTGC